MTEKESKLKVLNKVAESKVCQSSKTTKKLLCFLVEASINNREVKEFTIGREVFDKKDFDPAEDSSVRVYVSNLRKRLEEYYREEGANDAIKIDIPKGHYEVVFVDAGTKQAIGKQVTDKRLPYIFWAAGSLIVVLAGLLIISLMSGHGSTYTHDFIWDEFNSSTSPKTLILGNDFFFFKEKRKTR